MVKKDSFLFCFVLSNQKRETESSRVGSDHGEVILADAEIRGEGVNYKT